MRAGMSGPARESEVAPADFYRRYSALWRALAISFACPGRRSGPRAGPAAISITRADGIRSPIGDQLPQMMGRNRARSQRTHARPLFDVQHQQAQDRLVRVELLVRTGGHQGPGAVE